MSNSPNPYASPEIVPDPTLDSNVPLRIEPAGQGRRLANLVIDQVVQIVIGLVLGVLAAIFGGEEFVEKLDRIPDMLLGVAILLPYYIVCEATIGRTLGKLVTGTRVVDESGRPPTFKQVVIRSLCRLIPFEAFTFLDSPPRGLHDRLAKTYVVRS